MKYYLALKRTKILIHGWNWKHYEKWNKKEKCSMSLLLLDILGRHIYKGKKWIKVTKDLIEADELLFNVYKVIIHDAETLLDMGNGKGYTEMLIYLMP